MSRPARLAVLLWCLLLAGGFSVAFQLQPDPRGFGTHQQLGLPPCSFRFLVNVPCPSCGMTTAFAHFVRGHWIESLRASCSGFLFALVCAVQIPWCLLSLWTGRFWWVRRLDVLFLAVLLLLSGTALLEWLVRWLRS